MTLMWWLGSAGDAATDRGESMLVIGEKEMEGGKTEDGKTGGAE